MQERSVLSQIFGWTYFACWSVSFYPQIWLNWKRKSCRGLSLDFVVCNMWGFICLAIYNTTLYANEFVQQEFKRRYGDDAALIPVNDVAFVWHVLVLSVVICVQVVLYRTPNARGLLHRPSKLAIGYVAATLCAAIVWAALCLSSASQWIDWLYFLSFVKLGATLLKCIPQLYLNYKIKATIGWSIWNILLDSAGGVLSIGQLLIDAYTSNNWQSVVGNPIKLGLGSVSLLLDIVFYMQHYVWYRDHTNHLRSMEEQGLDWNDYVEASSDEASIGDGDKDSDILLPDDAADSLRTRA